MKTALVTGACGLLGQNLVNQLVSKYNVVAVDVSPDIFERNRNLKFINCDLTEHRALSNLLSKIKPEFIYNCAAYTDVDGCEKYRDKAYTINVELVRNLIDSGTSRIVQYSTDYVFNGDNGPYAENDPTDPVGYYGETKLISERMLLGSSNNNLVIRTNVLFGTGVDIRPNFITWLIASLKQGKKLKIVTDQFNNPIHAENLAAASIEAEEYGLTGVLHLGGADYLSRFEIAVITAEFFKFEKELITPVKTSELGQTAKRPMKGGLKIDLANRMLNTRMLNFEEGLGLIKLNNSRV